MSQRPLKADDQMHVLRLAIENHAEDHGPDLWWNTPLPEREEYMDAARRTLQKDEPPDAVA